MQQLETTMLHDASVTLQTRDGRRFVVRHIRPEDCTLLEAMFWQLSSETRWRRFFAPLDNVDPARVQHEAKRLAAINPQHEVALIALVEEEGQTAAVAVARYAGLLHERDCAETSIVVRDDYQHQGLGTQLFDLLVQVALARGLRHLVFLTHADNSGVIAMLQRSGLPFAGRFTSGTYEVDVQLVDGIEPVFPFSRSEQGHN